MTLPLQHLISPKLSSPNPASNTPSSESGSWASVGKNVQSKTISIAPTKTQNKPSRKFIVLNKYDERLDSPLPKADRVNVERLNARIQQQKFCNEHHLRGKCTNDRCPYAHGERLTGMDLLALKHKARTRPCQYYGQCRDMDCYSGHMCVAEACPFDQCHFADLHHIDRVGILQFYYMAYYKKTID
jgi:hypothetical protein